MAEERTAPTAYGKMEVVCSECMTTTLHILEVGPEGFERWTLGCAHCGHAMNVGMDVGELPE